MRQSLEWITPTKTQLALCRLHLRTWASIPAMKLSAGPLSLFLVPGRKFGLASPPLPAADLLLYSNAEQCMRQQTSHLQDRQILCSIDSSHEKGVQNPESESALRGTPQPLHSGRYQKFLPGVHVSQYPFRWLLHFFPLCLRSSQTGEVLWMSSDGRRQSTVEASYVQY